MTRLTLPFLTSSTKAFGRTGKPKFGWADADVDVREADPSEFGLAYCRASIANASYNIYVRNGLFWASVDPSHRGFELSGVLDERAVSLASNLKLSWQREIGSDAFMRRLLVRSRTEGFRAERDWFGDFKTTIGLEPGDGCEPDRHRFETWTHDNLVTIDGRLLKRVHAPGFAISWGPKNKKIGADTTIVRERSYLHSFCRNKFDPGLHFRINDPAFMATWDEARKLPFKTMTHLVGENYERKIFQSLSVALKDHGLFDRMAILDNVAYDPLVLADVTESGWEDMAERSLVSIAESVLATSAPHLHRPGQKRDVLDELKRIVDIVADERSEDFMETLEATLAALPIEQGNPLQWFVTKALDMATDREIAILPTASFRP